MNRHLTSSRWGYLKLSAVAFTVCICIILSSVSTVATPAWIVQSNEFTALLDDAISAEDCREKFDLTEELQEIDPQFRSCRRQRIGLTVEKLQQKLAEEKNPALHIDLEMLVKVGQQALRSDRLDDRYRLPYTDLSLNILDSLESTASKSKSAAKRQSAILTKLKQYTGEGARASLVSTLEQAIAIKLQDSATVFPSKAQIKQDLDENAAHIYQIQTFLKQQEVPNYESVYAQLKTQLFDYETFIRREVLPEANNFRLPIELYRQKLTEQGVEIPIPELMREAHIAFDRIQQEMQSIAPKIARQKGIEELDYRNVIKLLKQEQLSPQDTLRLYQDRAEELEKIIQREHLVSLPQNKFQIRLATDRENQTFPVPFYDALSNTFVIPALRNRQKAKQYNDFTNPAMSWTLTAHEGRPGHDLQFAAIADIELSDVRTGFASNATSTEGWATYAEGVMLPYMPLDGQLMSLQFQLLRAARAFLEPELQLGRITKADALKILTQDVGFSKFFAKQEIKRYTSTMVGQAPAYFYGAWQFRQLRSQARQILGKQFSPQRFHDLVLSQGFLSPKLLERIIRQSG